jgi:hypothetical protein
MKAEELGQDSSGPYRRDAETIFSTHYSIDNKRLEAEREMCEHRGLWRVAAGNPDPQALPTFLLWLFTRLLYKFITTIFFISMACCDNDLGVISRFSSCLKKVDANEYYYMPVATQGTSSSLSPSFSSTSIASSGLYFDDVCSRWSETKLSFGMTMTAFP